MSGEDRVNAITAAVDRFAYAVGRAADEWEPDGAPDEPGPFETKRIWRAEADKRRAALLALIFEQAA